MRPKKRVPGQEQRMEHISPARSSYSLFPGKLQSRGCLADVTGQPSVFPEALPGSPLGLVRQGNFFYTFPH